jgi:hypothetical protein
VLVDANRGPEGSLAMGHLARDTIHLQRELGPVPALDEDWTRSWLPR